MAPGMGMGTGRAIAGAGQAIGQQIMQATLGTEILYSFVIIAISLMIYFCTRDLYNLSGYKGIKYFRMSFLFFAIAYFFRSFIKFLVMLFDVRELAYFVSITWGIISLFFLMYASSMAIFYLLLSVSWKKWGPISKEWFFHIVAIIIAVTSILVNKLFFVLMISIILFMFILITLLISYIKSKKKRRGSHLHGIYALLSIFWILHTIDILIPNVLQTYHLVHYIASISIFLVILYRVLRKLG